MYHRLSHPTCLEYSTFILTPPALLVYKVLEEERNKEMSPCLLATVGRLPPSYRTSLPRSRHSDDGRAAAPLDPCFLRRVAFLCAKVRSFVQRVSIVNTPFFPQTALP